MDIADSAITADHGGRFVFRSFHVIIAVIFSGLGVFPAGHGTAEAGLVGDNGFFDHDIAADLFMIFKISALKITGRESALFVGPVGDTGRALFDK